MINILSRNLLTRFSTTEGVKKFILPQLTYGYSELQPMIGAKLLEIHHKKHHNTYVNNLNAALQQFQEAKALFDYGKMASLCNTIKFNLGGHINHSIYWKNLAPIGQGGGQYAAPDSPFTAQIIKQFGQTVAIQGSGWGWLGYDTLAQSLRIIQLPNQQMMAPIGLTPLLTIDVWQHAYYLSYKNARLDYVKQIWKIINWKDAEKRFLSVAKK